MAMKNAGPLGRFSLGMGDRFAQQGRAQLAACVQAKNAGAHVTPVWNKSHREHSIVGSAPADVRREADAAVAALGWQEAYFVDADHIRLETVDAFLAASDFFTIDVAETIGKSAGEPALESFCQDLGDCGGAFGLTREAVQRIAGKYLAAVQEAARIYRRIENAKGRGSFVTEVSMDETDAPQTPDELFVILAALAREGVPVDTIAPKFTGRFNKGVDYVGDPDQFEREFEADISAIRLAVEKYGLPAHLKLSVHSGSDKFSLYPRIRRVLERTGAGVHVKTAGTTWLEELIGLAEAGGGGLQLAKEIYAEAHAHLEELCSPYAAVIDIDPAKLPSPEAVLAWNSEQFVAALRHDPACPDFNPHLRQLLHVGYKVAAKVGSRYLEQVRACEETVSRNVTHNLLERHIRPLWLG
jgi:hypothetical protein